MHHCIWPITLPPHHPPLTLSHTHSSVCLIKKKKEKSLNIKTNVGFKALTGCTIQDSLLLRKYSTLPVLDRAILIISYSPSSSFLRQCDSERTAASETKKEKCILAAHLNATVRRKESIIFTFPYMSV